MTSYPLRSSESTPEMMRVVSSDVLERPIGNLWEVTAGVLKIMAIAALILGFVFESAKLAVCGVVIGVFSFALHLGARPMVNETFLARTLRFFVPERTRDYPMTPPPRNYSPARNSFSTPPRHSVFVPTLDTIASPNIDPLKGQKDPSPLGETSPDSRSSLSPSDTESLLSSTSTGAKNRRRLNQANTALRSLQSSQEWRQSNLDEQDPSVDENKK